MWCHDEVAHASRLPMARQGSRYLTVQILPAVT